VLKTL